MKIAFMVSSLTVPLEDIALTSGPLLERVANLAAMLPASVHFAGRAQGRTGPRPAPTA
jgi:hypothetical protein